MTIEIRPYHPTDLASLYRICLQTGDNGNDASGLYADPFLLGHLWAGPYAVLEPELCFVLTNDHEPIGYILGTADTALFGTRCEAEWFPPLRQRYSMPAPGDNSREAASIRQIHQGHERSNQWPEFPAHLHIDILPQGQKQGWGRKLMEHFCHHLAEQGVGGVFLGVSPDNGNAVDFYRHLDFEPVEGQAGILAKRT